MILEAEVELCNVNNLPPPGVFSYAWTQLSGPGVVLDRPTQVTNTYRLAANALTAGVYEFQVSVDLNDNLNTVGRAVVVVNVLASSLVALPTGMQVDTRLGDVMIVGSQSQDADRVSAVPSYAWSCLEQSFPAEPCVVSSLLSASIATTRGLVEFPAANLAPGPWEFGLVFVKGARRARTRHVVVVQWNEAPSGRLELIDPSTLQIVAVGSPASAVNLFNAREPLVVSAARIRVSPGAAIASWRWVSSSPALSLASALGTSGPVLYLPPASVTPGAGVVLSAIATDTRNFSSTFQFSFFANDEPRAVIPGFSGCVASVSSPVVSVLSSVLSISCQGWTDDSGHFPLGYLFRSSRDGFALSSGFIASSSFRFVLPSAADASTLQVHVRDALGAWTVVSVSLPAGTSVVPAFIATDAQSIEQTAQQLISAQLLGAVRVGSVERIDQTGQGIMLGLTSVVSSVNASSSLDALRRQWLVVVDLLDKYVVQQPSLLWSGQQGVKLSTWTRNAILLSPALQNVTLTIAQQVLAAQLPSSEASVSPGWPAMLSNVLAAISVHPPLPLNVSQSVSARFLNVTRAILGSQIGGGPAVPQSTRTARYDQPRISLAARLDSFGTFFSPALGSQSIVAGTPLPLNLSLPFFGRQNVFSLSLDAAAQISNASPFAHGLAAWVTDVDPFPWSSRPPMVLASDVIALTVTRSDGQSDIVFDANLFMELPLTRATNPNASFYALACARWDEPIQLWTTRNCSLLSTSSVARCVCGGPGVFTAVWAPLLTNGPSQTPLLPLGPAPGLVPIWLPIVVALILLFLMGLLLLLFCCYKHAAPVLSQPLRRNLLAAGEVEDSDEWTTHLKRPVHLHAPGMPPDTGVIFYENTSSGEDDWPDRPDLSRVNPPLLPRQERQPFVGGRVALLRDDGGAGMVIPEGEVLLAPANNAFDRTAIPYLDEQRRYDRQLGIEDSEQYSTEEKKAK